MTALRKVTIATPIRHGLDSNYMKWFIPTIQRGLPGIELNHLVIEGPSVNFARNACATAVLESNQDEIWFIDDDMGPTTEMLERFGSHDVDIVAGYYCKRKPGKPQWLFVPKPGAEKQPNGLLECSAVATGALRIKTHVLRKIAEVFPWNAFDAKDTEAEPVRRCHDWFRMGVVGPDTPEGKLEEINQILFDEDWASASTSSAINNVIERKPQPGRLLGEDYFFCRDARKAGFKVWVDLDAPPWPHFGTIGFPIPEAAVGWGPNVVQKMPTAEEL